MVLIRVGGSFKGLLFVGDRKYGFEITERGDLSQPFFLKLDWRLKKILGASLKNFLQNNDFSDVEDFHVKLSNFVTENIPVNVKSEEWLKNPLCACALVKTLQADIQNVGEHIKNIDIEKKTVEIEVTDAQFRIHKAVLKLSPEYPKGYIRILQQDLPSVKTIFNEDMFDLSRVCTIVDFTRKFINVVKTFQEFWDILATVDLQCLVLDPANPTFKDTFRRIKIHESLSVGITLDPLRPKQLPSIKLFGSHSDVENCREMLQRNLEKEIWDCNGDLIYNISNLLDVTVPNKMFVDDADLFQQAQDEECAICFMCRLDDELPNEICEWSTCKLKYHSVCLFKYLTSFPKNREYFGKVQGECPGCDNVISCSVPKSASLCIGESIVP